MTDIREVEARGLGGGAAFGRPLPGRPPRAGAGKRTASGLALAVATALDHRRLFILLPFAIIAGLAVSLVANPADPLALLSGAVLVPLAAVAAYRSLTAARVLMLAAAFWLGFSLLAVHGALFGTEMLARPAYGTYVYRIDQVLSSRADGQRVIVSDIAPAEDGRALPVRRARLAIAEGPELAPGDLVEGQVRFYPVPGPVLPDSFDTQFHAYFDGIGAYGTTTRPPRIKSPGDPGTIERVIGAIREGIGIRIDGVLVQPAAGIARALITGDQSLVDENARETMATAGLAHVLSISGLHLTLVAGGIFIALRMALAVIEPVARRVPVKRLAAVGGLVAALLYFSISGGSVAAVRATIMIVLVLGAVIAGRRALTMRNVAIAALVIVVSDPASVFRPSFQLSFAAVVALIGAWELARGREGGERSFGGRILAYFGGIAATSLVAGAATLLFSIYHFQQTSPLGILGNLVSLPLVAFVMMPSAVVAVLAMPFGFEGPFLLSMGWSVDRMLDLAGLVEQGSRGIDASPLLTPLSLVLGLAALAWFAFFASWHRLIGPALLVPAVIIFALDRPPDVVIADTTQALAIRLDDDLAVVGGKADSFAVEVWRETYGEPLQPVEIACDSIACTGKSNRGFRFAVAHDPAAVYEECGVDLIVVRGDSPAACTLGTVIGTDDLTAGGVHWLRWDEGARRFEIRRAIPDRERPWRAPF